MTATAAVHDTILDHAQYTDPMLYDPQRLLVAAMMAAAVASSAFFIGRWYVGHHCYRRWEGGVMYMAYHLRHKSARRRS